MNGNNGTDNFQSLESPESWTLSKPVTLAEGGLRLDVSVERKEIGKAIAWAWPIAGLLLIVASFFKARKVASIFGLNIAVALAAAAQNPEIISPLSWLIVIAVLIAIAVGCVRAARRKGVARYVAPPPMPVVPPDEILPAESSQSGRVDLRALFVCALVSLAAFAVLAAEPAKKQMAEPVKPATAPVVIPVPPPAPLNVVMTRVSASVDLPGPTTDGTPPSDANVTLQLSFKAAEAGDFLLLPGKFVLSSFTSSLQRVEVIAKEGGYWLRIGEKKSSGWFSRPSKSGEECNVSIHYRAGVADAQGSLQTLVYLPAHLANDITLKLPTPEWTVESSAAAFLKISDNATAKLIASGSDVPLMWKPKTRNAKLEKASFFAELQTIARARSGLVSLSHFVRYQIAQGELQTLQFDVPTGATVTAVSGPGLGTWRFDPATRLLEAVLEKPVSGSYGLRVVTQVAREGLPYEAELRELTVRDAVSQRGVIAIVADDGVQVTPGDSKGAAAMYPGDFPAEALAAESGGAAEVKRAFRYQNPPVAIPISAARVESELRATEEARVDITDERVVLSSRLQIDIAKAGVFTVWLELPEGFDIDALSGDDVSHWDEVKDSLGVPPLGGIERPAKAGTPNVRAVAVHFVRQAQGMRNLNVVLSRQEKNRLDEIDVPRIAVRGALKHNGTLAISTERGLRATTVKRDGATEVNPRDLGIQQQGYLGFRLLRPDWSLRLKVETAQAVVKAEVVQRVTVSEGMLQARCRVIYSIEHAGVKTFRLRAPQPGVALVVTGPNLARVQQADPTNGIWEIELTAKREGSASFDVTYQVPYDASSGKAAIKSLICEDMDNQKGWLAVFAGGRLEVKLTG